MLIDVLLDPFAATWDELRRAAEAAEEAGFAGVWTWDHLAGQVHGEDRVLECWTTLSALASVTERVAIGPLVLNCGSRHPGVVAQMAATLQEVSGGRLLLGLGAGGGATTPYVQEQRALGMRLLPDATRRAQVADTALVCRQLWTGVAEPLGTTTVALGAGRGFLRPQPRPPIVVAGFGPKMAEVAGRVGDGFNTQAAHPRLEELTEIARAGHAARATGTPFLATAFAGLGRDWLPGGRGHTRAAAAGVDRLVLVHRTGEGPAPLTRAAPLLR